MTLVNVQTVSQIFRAQVELLVVSVNDAGSAGNVLITNADGTTILVGFVAAASITLTRDAIKTALDASPIVTGLYTTADVSTDGVSLTQIRADGPMSAVGNALQGSLAITPSTTTTAAHTIPRYLLSLRSPVAGSTNDTYVSRDSGRSCAGEYNLIANAVTNTLNPSISVEDTNDLLAPIPGPALKGESSGYMDNGLTTAKNGPDWVKEWVLNKEEIEIGDPVATRVSNDNYTILTSDRVVYLSSTTSGGDHTITFGTGVDGQVVSLVVELSTGTDEFVIAGVEDAPSNLDRTGNVMTMTYDAVADKWRVVSRENHTQIRRIADASGTVNEYDKEIHVVTTTSGGDYTLTLDKAHDGAKVTIFMIQQIGTDKMIISGSVSGGATLNGFEDFGIFQYDAVNDIWIVLGFKFTP